MQQQQQQQWRNEDSSRLEHLDEACVEQASARGNGAGAPAAEHESEEAGHCDAAAAASPSSSSSTSTVIEGQASSSAAAEAAVPDEEDVARHKEHDEAMRGSAGVDADVGAGSDEDSGSDATDTRRRDAPRVSYANALRSGGSGGGVNQDDAGAASRSAFVAADAPVSTDAVEPETLLTPPSRASSPGADHQ